MVEVGQVYRDKDKRMSGGNRHVLVVALNGGRRANKAVCVPCYSDGKRFYEVGTHSTTHNPKNLEKRFELVQPKDSLAA